MKYSVCSVTQVNEHIRDLLDADVTLGALFVRGEISNYKAYPSGHHYFSLKDAEGAVRCVLFRGRAAGLRFQPADGMKVIALGQVTLFVRDGAYQLQCASLIPEGVGDLHMAFEQLKEKLYREGLFDEDHKKPHHLLCRGRDPRHLHHPPAPVAHGQDHAPARPGPGARGTA